MAARKAQAPPRAMARVAATTAISRNPRPWMTGRRGRTQLRKSPDMNGQTRVPGPGRVRRHRATRTEATPVTITASPRVIPVCSEIPSWRTKSGPRPSAARTVTA